MFPSTESSGRLLWKETGIFPLFVVTCAATSEEKHQAKHPGAKPKKHPSELPESPEEKKSSVQQASTTTVGTMSCNRDVVLEGNLRSQSSEQMPLNPNNSESLTQPSLPLYSNQEPILHDRYILKLLP